MKQLQLRDAEFGIIVVNCNPRAKRVVLRLLPSGDVRITIPHQRHLAAASQLVNDARTRIRNQRAELLKGHAQYQPGMVVGRSHQLNFRAEMQRNDITTRVADNQIIIRYPIDLPGDDAALQAKIHEAVKKALRREATEFLPGRVEELARLWGYSFQKVRISSGHTRWGSCSSDGTISLNLWLMDLPDELITYVICHELCHTVQHNHSERFWALVTKHLPDYKITRKKLKAIHPR
jgi:predicted metal-dependent hydrolase